MYMYMLTDSSSFFFFLNIFFKAPFFSVWLVEDYVYVPVYTSSFSSTMLAVLMLTSSGLFFAATICVFCSQSLFINLYVGLVCVLLCIPVVYVLLKMRLRNVKDFLFFSMNKKIFVNLTTYICNMYVICM